ncbi:hypothetical protein [Methanobrevibacter sp.]|uniref:hypothetical protein n=1 Tax=Methanobrevibacter sp. TaxID=66852 RepID=UPI0026E033CF|nr:hypothetical protein [Methanobrevibacter sp.]MDO5823745.1 hypothetical protein [Methanobrevibacter sp.]
MGSTIKLVSGFILFVVGVLIAYETSVYNLIDILLVVGIIISIVGIILMISYFVDSNAYRTTNMIKEFLESKEQNSPSFYGFEKNNSDEGPLKIRRDYDDLDVDYEDLVIEDYDDSTPNVYYGESFGDDSKTVSMGENELNLDKQLVFTPNYGRPLKVTRVPRKRQSKVFEDEIPEIVVEHDKSEEIKRALEEPAPKENIGAPTLVSPKVAENRDIKIDINNPESLPVPKSLRSHVICDGDFISSQDAFDHLACNVKKEIMLEIPSLNDLSDRFLSHVPTSYSRVIIDEFDVSDMSYIFLISSLLKQGVHIKTVPKVHTVNLITDDSHAMIISEGFDDVEYGAVYDDRNSISDIRANFEKTWNIASNLDENILVGNGGVA